MNSHYQLFPAVANSLVNDATSTQWLIHSSSYESQQDFLHRAQSWATVLPHKKYMVLLTKQRRHFLSGFVAAQINRQTVLLPSNSSAGAIADIVEQYPDSYLLLDEPLSTSDALILNHVLKLDCIDFRTVVKEQLQLEQNIDPEHIAAIAFTSGTTGAAKPYPKTWASLVQGAHLAKQRFGFDTQHSIIATVPSQHMYGLETTVMVPLIVGCQLFADKPFFPEDIRLALEQSPGKRVLVTTPIHLRACVAANFKWPEIDMIISATAPLHQELLQQATTTFNAPVLEIYGCTEAGSIASREPSNSQVWTLYDDFSIADKDDNTVVSAPHLSEDVILSDVVKIVEQGQFLLLGRHTDMVNIAGKRASLNGLNLILNAIDGVEDGIFIVPDENGKAATRLTALVVAPNIKEDKILAELAQKIDSVFLPRPFYKVAALPRNETGKISRADLLQLLKKPYFDKPNSDKPFPDKPISNKPEYLA